MRIVLIPCSGQKARGGYHDFNSPVLARLLGAPTFKSLLETRDELARELCLRPGPDIRNECETVDIEFLPAFMRYKGKMYQKAEFSCQFTTFRGRVFIISALYGILEASDFIRDYNLEMGDTLPCGEKVWKRWKRRDLRNYLNVVLLNSDATEVHDLLTQNYRKALGDLETTEKYKVIRYEYPGLGIGSLYRRGDDLEKILTNR